MNIGADRPQSTLRDQNGFMNKTTITALGGEGVRPRKNQTTPKNRCQTEERCSNMDTTGSTIASGGEPGDNEGNNDDPRKLTMSTAYRYKGGAVLLDDSLGAEGQSPTKLKNSVRVRSGRSGGKLPIKDIPR